ncbi:hypothetical protein ALQ20_03600 [Pseudomonas syringae pv. atrofaciens]|uniref:hypothetical protein n=1 Tax=Pseudomonas syringae TaxID=317 RepID=UPI000EFFCC7B|nr:hypothetical protein [Pseudomonas syringae]RMP75073.1 hypothetical protein ALQ20_03600 [Pseudomonas syringae pv. atrofaciens]
MTRWNQEFSQHPFNQTWRSLLSAVKESDVDDLTIVTTVQELARLKKALFFVDGIINGVDLELTPISVWANCQHQADACLRQVQNYEHTRNVIYLIQANEHADNLLTYVRPYMVHPKEAIKAYSTAVKAFSDQVSDYIDTFQSKTSKYQSDLESSVLKAVEQNKVIKEIERRAKRFEAYIFEGTDGHEPAEQFLERMITKAEIQYQSISTLHQDLLVNPGSLHERIINIEKELTSLRDLQHELTQDSTTKHEDLELFYERIFGSRLADDDEIQEDGLNRELELRLEQLTTFEIEQSKRQEALFASIESLLPGATSAGLASSYKNLKDDFKRPIDNYTFAFYGAMATLLLGGLALIIDSFTLWPLHIELSRAAGWEEMLRTLLTRLPVVLPIVWFAIFSATRRSQYERLQQEYAHKEAIASSYESYKKQLKELNVAADSLQLELIGKAIEAISFNASKTLDGKHEEKLPIMQLLEKLNVDEFKKLLDLVRNK